MSSSGIVRVTIDGLEVPCGGEFGGPTWVFTTGVTAPEIVWKLDPAAADQVLSKREVTITIEYEKRTLTIQRVVVVKEVPTGSYFSRGVLLSDVRWYWSRKWVKRSYNVRMRTGSKRLVNAPAGTPTQLTQFADDIAFAKYSLKLDKKGTNSIVWNADDMLADVMQRLAGSGVKFKARSRSALKPNDIEVDDRGDQALARVLAAAGGGIDITVDASGSVIVFDRVLGAERTMIQKLIPYSLLNLGQLRWVRMNHILPATIYCLFTRECELRLDYKEEAANATISIPDDEPYVDNVCQIADFSIPITSAGKTNTEVMGTWVKLTDYLQAINSNPGAGPFPQPQSGFNPPQALDTGVLQDRYLGPFMYLQYVTGFGVLPSQVWSGRIGSLMKSYRLDFRLNRRFLSRILPGSIRAVRVGLSDAVTGMRHPSPVYMDYAERPTLRLLASNPDAALGWNIHCIPPTTWGQTLPNGIKPYSDPININDCHIAPAVLSVVDAQAGVIRVEMRKDDFDQAEELIPSLVANLPTTNPFRVATASALATWDQCSIAKNHRMITIVSCIPAGPNNEAQLQSYAVSFDTALQKLNVQKGDMRADGPALEQRVGPALERARYTWDDSQRAACLAIFSEDGTFPSVLQPMNLDIMKDVSEALSATLVSTMLDHYEGVQSVEFNPDLTVAGSVHSVAHGVDPTGRCLTTVNAEPRGPVIRPESLMSTATRRVLYREITA